MRVADIIRKDPWGALFITLLFLSIPFGALMALFTNNAEWLFFCIPLILFLS